MPTFDRRKFFQGFRDKIDSTIEQEQVDGLRFLLGKMEVDPFWKDIRHIAYALATAGHETAWSFQPVTEGYYLAKTDPPDYAGNTARVKRFQKTLRYYPYHGRGYVQLTWKKNYEKAGRILSMDMVNKPQLALDREGAYKTMTYGMHQGWFTGKKLTDYISDTGKDYKNARKIINGLDKASLISGYANQFEQILRDSKTTSAAAPAAIPSLESDLGKTANGDVIPTPNEQPPGSSGDITETKTTEVAQQGGLTTAVEQTTPGGDHPEVPPTLVSKNGPLAKWLLSGGLAGLGAFIWTYIQSNPSAVAIAIICVTALIVAIIFRGAITDAVRMQAASDPTKKNVS